MNQNGWVPLPATTKKDVFRLRLFNSMVITTYGWSYVKACVAKVADIFRQEQ